jgi:rubrerythrin
LLPTDNNKRSMNREEELTDILRKVEWGQLDSAVAFDRILRLFSVVGRSELLVCPDCVNGRDEFEPNWKCPECRRNIEAN